MIFERLGAVVETIAAEPDGRNINDGCGSTHLENLAAHVASGEAEIGFAFDGDGDQVLAVDGAGHSHDGDELIALAARGMAARGELGGGVAVTVMSNFGFHRAMEEAGIEVATTQVGDRYVLDELRARDWAVGGEQSGHIIDTRIVATGDGIGAALATMRELDGADLAGAVPMEKLPQVDLQIRELQEAAALLKRQINIVRASSESEIDTAFATVAQQGATALLVAQDPYFHDQTRTVSAAGGPT